MDSARTQFEDFLEERGLRFTSQRRRILAQVLAMKGHFEAEDLHDRFRRKKERVSKASVYRTLPLLVEAGLLREVEFVERHAHYENLAGREQHEHLVCTSCGKVIEFRKPSLEKALAEVARAYGFEEKSHKVEITGLCKQCRKDSR
jgi:Fur family ferric uptake transcriptional regulator